MTVVAGDAAGVSVSAWQHKSTSRRRSRERSSDHEADKIDLTRMVGLTFESIMRGAQMVDGNAVLNLQNGAQITLIGVEVASLHADVFVLAA